MAKKTEDPKETTPIEDVVGKGFDNLDGIVDEQLNSDGEEDTGTQGIMSFAGEGAEPEPLAEGDPSTTFKITVLGGEPTDPNLDLDGLVNGESVTLVAADLPKVYTFKNTGYNVLQVQQESDGIIIKEIVKGKEYQVTVSDINVEEHLVNIINNVPMNQPTQPKYNATVSPSALEAGKQTLFIGSFPSSPVALQSNGIVECFVGIFDRIPPFAGHNSTGTPNTDIIEIDNTAAHFVSVFGINKINLGNWKILDKYDVEFRVYSTVGPLDVKYDLSETNQYHVTPTIGIVNGNTETAQFMLPFEDLVTDGVVENLADLSDLNLIVSVKNKVTGSVDLQQRINLKTNIMEEKKPFDITVNVAGIADDPDLNLGGLMLNGQFTGEVDELPLKTTIKQSGENELTLVSNTGPVTITELVPKKEYEVSIDGSEPIVVNFENKKAGEEPEPGDFLAEATAIVESQFRYNYLICGRLLVDGITEDSLKAFYNEWVYYGIKTEADGKLMALFKSHFGDPEPLAPDTDLEIDPEVDPNGEG